jgi:hypothetical protein
MASSPYFNSTPPTSSPTGLSLTNLSGARHNRFRTPPSNTFGRLTLRSPTIQSANSHTDVSPFSCFSIVGTSSSSSLSLRPTIKDMIPKGVSKISSTPSPPLALSLVGRTGVKKPSRKFISLTNSHAATPSSSSSSSSFLPSSRTTNFTSSSNGNSADDMIIISDDEDIDPLQTLIDVCTSSDSFPPNSLSPTPYSHPSDSPSSSTTTLFSVPAPQDREKTPITPELSADKLKEMCGINHEDCVVCRDSLSPIFRLFSSSSSTGLHPSEIGSTLSQFIFGCSTCKHPFHITCFRRLTKNIVIPRQKMMKDLYEDSDDNKSITLPRIVSVIKCPICRTHYTHDLKLTSPRRNNDIATLCGDLDLWTTHTNRGEDDDCDCQTNSQDSDERDNNNMSLSSSSSSSSPPRRKKPTHRIIDISDFKTYSRNFSSIVEPNNNKRSNASNNRLYPGFVEHAFY